MRRVYIFFKISNARWLWFTRFVRFANMKLFCKSANENKNNFMFATLTKYVNNQANCCITLEKLKKIWICLVLIQLYHTYQLSSPSIVRRSPNCPGILSSISIVIRGANFPWFCITNHLSAILMGVVKQEVNKSAGNSGFIGNNWVAEQAANWMQLRFDIGGDKSADEPCAATCSWYSRSCCSANCSKLETMIPAFEQSYTNIEGEPILKKKYGKEIEICYF